MDRASRPAPGITKESLGGIYTSKVVDRDYYSIGRVPSVEVQDRIGWRARSDTQPWPIPESLDWSADPYRDRNWVSQFHSWRFMDPYLRAYKETGEPRYLARLIPWMTSWSGFREAAPESEQERLSVLGGMRTTRLALVLDAYRSGQSGAVELTRQQRDVLYGLGRRDAEWLATPGHISRMNHAYFQVLGVELLCRVMSDEPWAARVRDTMADIFNDLVQSQFTTEGVHIEDSPCYHSFALDQIERAGALETLAFQETRRLVERAKWVLPWLVFPDGRYADIGDCTGSAEPLSDPGGNIEAVASGRYAVAPFWRSGYGVVRSLPEVPAERASMLLLMGASSSPTHGHADKLSFELFEFGKRVLVDSGKYGHVRGPMRAYVESAVAHNTVGLADDPMPRSIVKLGGTRLAEPRIEQDAFLLKGEVEWATERFAFRHARLIIYRPGEFLLIEDTLTSDRPRQYVSRLHFDRSLVVEHHRRRLKVAVNGHMMLVEMLNLDSDVAVHRGEDEPARGWQSVGDRQAEPTTMVEAVCPGQNRTITWLITFDDAPDAYDYYCPVLR